MQLVKNNRKRVTSTPPCSEIFNPTVTILLCFINCPWHKSSLSHLIHQSVWIPRAVGNPGDTDSFLTSHPGGYDNDVQTQGQIWHFKIKRFALPLVGNRGDSDTKGTNEGGDFIKRNFQMSESPGGSRPWWFTLTGAL